MGVMTKTQAPTVKQLRLHDNAVDVTAQYVGTTVALIGARPQHLSLKANVTSAPSGPSTHHRDDEDRQSEAPQGRPQRPRWCALTVELATVTAPTMISCRGVAGSVSTSFADCCQLRCQAP